MTFLQNKRDDMLLVKYMHALKLLKIHHDATLLYHCYENIYKF